MNEKLLAMTVNLADGNINSLEELLKGKQYCFTVVLLF